MSIRSFIAVEVPADVQDALARAVGRLKQANVAVRWTATRNVHVTVKFLGDLIDDDVPRIHRALADEVKGMKPFDVEVAGLGAFPPRGAPRILWAGLRGDTAPLVDLAERIEKRMAEDFGIRPEARAYHPHLTLGRVKTTRGAARLVDAMQALEPFDAGSFTVDALAFMMSELTREGSVYTRMSEAKFG